MLYTFPRMLLPTLGSRFSALLPPARCIDISSNKVDIFSCHGSANLKDDLQSDAGLLGREDATRTETGWHSDSLKRSFKSLTLQGDRCTKCLVQRDMQCARFVAKAEIFDPRGHRESQRTSQASAQRFPPSHDSRSRNQKRGGTE